jgi:ABC-type nitrate/sulfonate/bicarbonate transport system substrate-binding protein
MTQNLYYSVLIRPDNYGINYIGTVYFTLCEIVDKKEKLVQAFVNSLVLGWKNAIANPNQAIKYLYDFNSKIDEKKERMSFEKGIEYFKGENGRILYSSKERWLDMANSLQKMNVINNFRFENNIEYRFLERAIVEVSL